MREVERVVPRVDPFLPHRPGLVEHGPQRRLVPRRPHSEHVRLRQVPRFPEDVAGVRLERRLELFSAVVRQRGKVGRARTERYDVPVEVDHDRLVGYVLDGEGEVFTAYSAEVGHGCVEHGTQAPGEDGYVEVARYCRWRAERIRHVIRD